MKKGDDKSYEPQDLNVRSPFPLAILDGKTEVVFEAMGGDLKWPAFLTSEGFRCAGNNKRTRKSCKMRNWLPEQHTMEQLKEMIHRHASCCIGVLSGRRPEYPISRTKDNGY